MHACLSVRCCCCQSCAHNGAHCMYVHTRCKVARSILRACALPNVVPSRCFHVVSSLKVTVIKVMCACATARRRHPRRRRAVAGLAAQDQQLPRCCNILVCPCCAITVHGHGWSPAHRLQHSSARQPLPLTPAHISKKSTREIAAARLHTPASACCTTPQMQAPSATRPHTQGQLGRRTPVPPSRPAARVATGAQQQSTLLATAPQPVGARDVSADILEAAIELSLKNRLTRYGSVDACVSCDTRGLLEGTFGRLAIQGSDWVTPLRMTAHELLVDIGTMQVDYSTLLSQRKVALRNRPAGSVKIRLSSSDMGRFVSHPLFIQAAATAVQGQAFVWDADSIQIQHSSEGGDVRFSGVWAGDGQRYRLLMRPGRPAAAAGAGGAVAARTQLQVGAQPYSPGGGDMQSAQLVAAGIARFFSSMALDLQGIELRSPSLSLHAGAVSGRGEGDLLEIGMALRIRGFPPLDMQF